MTTLRDVLTVRVGFDEFSERLACEPEALGLVKLLEFSELLALAPGDLVTVDHEGLATSVEPAPGYLIEAHFRLGTADEVVAHIAEAWARDTVVQKMTTSKLAVRCFAQTEDWVIDIVARNPLVEFVETVRVPGDPVSMTEVI